jgi:hypothetical protein
MLFSRRTVNAGFLQKGGPFLSGTIKRTCNFGGAELLLRPKIPLPNGFRASCRKKRAPTTPRLKIDRQF